MIDTDIVTMTATAFGAFRVRLVPDLDATDPRKDHEQIATFVLRHRRYDLPLEGDLVGQIDDAMERGGFALTARYLQAARGAAVVLPVWGHERGSLSLHAGYRAGAYADRWDSGLAGLAYITDAQVNAGWRDHGFDVTADELAAVVRSEVEEYDAYLQGEVYGYVVERATDADSQDWAQVDSCWGHVGHSWATQAATEALAAAVLQGAEDHARRRAEEKADEAEIDSLRLIEACA